jgi:hypothetical protein
MNKTKLASERTCVKIAGYHAAGVLLFSIQYCHYHTTFTYRGVPCIARSYEWWAEYTGLSVRQVDRAFVHLSKLGLIDREKHIREGKTILHLRLSEKGVQVLHGDTGAFHRQRRSHGLTTKGETGFTANGDSYISNQRVEIKKGSKIATCSARSREIFPEEELSEDLIKSPGTSADDCTSGNVVQFFGHGGPEMNSKKSSEVFAEQPAKQKIKAWPAMKPVNVATVIKLWREECLHAHGFKVGEPIGHERKLLIHVIKDAGEFYPGEGEALKFVANIIRRWGTFCEAAKEQQSAFEQPKYPSITYLYKYRNAAFNMKPAAAPKSKPAPKPAVLQKPAVGQPVPAHVSKPKVSEEEKKKNIAAMLAILNDDTEAA